ncbi:hypothetical protein KKF32_05340 [Patescibacteria group bacterium]|nr:hypothetical protein [Patescibacteria group bacterium]
MKLDPTTEMLFSPFDREVGNPRRWRIHTENDFIKFIEQNNGASDCYSSIYPADGTVDKIFFDIDSQNGVTGALDESRRLYTFLLSRGFNVIPILSGKKGFHFYLLLQPKQYDNAKSRLTRATLSVLSECFGYSDDGVIKTATVDPHIIGDIRRISRIPNTLRPPLNLTWCTYLPPDWVKMTTAELIGQMKSPIKYDYDLDGSFPTLDDFPDPPAEIMKWKEIEVIEPARPINDNTFLKKLLRPCLYRHMMSDHPGHAVRVASTVDLLQFFEPAKIVEMYRALGWTDWDPDETMKQIESCRRLKPYGCKKLRQLGIPEACCIG